MTIEEIRDKKFNTKLFGYGPKEVDGFIAMVAEAFEEVTNEAGTLAEEVKRLSDDLELYKGREESIIKTMMTSQKVCEDMKKNAEKESQIILAEAEIKAERILEEAEKKASVIRDEIMEIRRQKIQLEESLRAILNTHLKLIDISEEKPDKRDD